MAGRGTTRFFAKVVARTLNTDLSPPAVPRFFCSMILRPADGSGLRPAAKGGPRFRRPAAPSHRPPAGSLPSLRARLGAFGFRGKTDSQGWARLIVRSKAQSQNHPVCKGVPSPPVRGKREGAPGASEMHALRTAPHRRRCAEKGGGRVRVGDCRRPGLSPPPHPMPSPPGRAVGRG